MPTHRLPQVSVTARDDVPFFGPALPDPAIFKKVSSQTQNSLTQFIFTSIHHKLSVSPIAPLCICFLRASSSTNSSSPSSLMQNMPATRLRSLPSSRWEEYAMHAVCAWVRMPVVSAHFCIPVSIGVPSDCMLDRILFQVTTLFIIMWPTVNPSNSCHKANQLSCSCLSPCWCGCQLKEQFTQTGNSLKIIHDVLTSSVMDVGWSLFVPTTHLWCFTA